MRQPSVLDVVEAQLDGDVSFTSVTRLSDRQFAELFDALASFYASYSVPEPRGLRMALPMMETFSCPPPAYLNPALLYAHEAATPDLMAQCLDQALAKRARGETPDLQEMRRWVALPFMWLERIARLVEAEAVVPIPTQAGKWHRVSFPQYTPVEEFSPIELAAVAEVRRALADGPRKRLGLSADLRRHQIAIEELLADTYRGKLGPHSDERSLSMDAVWTFQGGLADLQFTTDAIARPFPLSDKDWTFFNIAAATPNPTELDLRVANGLATMKLPSFDRVNHHTRELLAARRDEEAFGEWRAGLRRAIRTIESYPPSIEFDRSARQALEDELLPLAAEVRRATSRSAALRRASVESGVSLSVGAAVMTGAGLAGNFDPAAALAGMSVGALGRVAAAYLLAGRRLAGQEFFVSAFMRAVEATDD
jgi:hypothetical protein